MKIRARVVLPVAAGFALLPATVCEAQAPFTVVLLPDTQFYSRSDPATYRAQTQWIVDHEIAENIKFVIHLGDITDNNTDPEWTRASAAHKILDDANVPYCIVPGNHDNPESGRKRDTSKYNEHFGPSRFSAKAWYGGHLESNNDNNYTFFEVGDLKFMVVGLEFAPTKRALCWADALIRRHPDHRIIIVTHCYQGHGGGYRSNCATTYDITGAGGLTTWSELVRRHNNVFMVLSGHVSDSERRTRSGNGGNPVTEILTDYQGERRNGVNHGNGWIRTLRFVPAEDRIDVKTVTVLTGIDSFNRSDYPSDPDHDAHRYSIPYDMTKPTPTYAYTKVSDAFNDMAVNIDSTHQQKHPEAAMGPDGAFVVVWEDDSHAEEGVYQIHARSFEGGGCERFGDVRVNAIASGQHLNPGVAMSTDGSVFVVWQDDSNENGLFDIKAAGYSASGAKLFGDIAVNANSSGQQRRPAIAVTSSDTFIVVWEDDNNLIHAAGFSASGGKQFDDITVDAAASGQQLLPDIAGSGNGDFVVVWEGESDQNGVYQVYAAGFNSTGNRRFGAIPVNAIATGQQRGPVVAVSADGSFVVVWEDDRNNDGVCQIHAAGFSRTGVRRFDDVVVNEVGGGRQRRPSIAMESNGAFVVSWEDDKDGDNFYEIDLARFDSSGTRLLSNITVNEDADGQHLWPNVVANGRGNLVVVWQDDLDRNGTYQILARGFAE